MFREAAIVPDRARLTFLIIHRLIRSDAIASGSDRIGNQVSRRNDIPHRNEAIRPDNFLTSKSHPARHKSNPRHEHKCPRMHVQISNILNELTSPPLT